MMCLIHIKCRLHTFAFILPVCTKLLQYSCKLWWQRWHHFAARLQQYQETQICWPSLLVIEIIQKLHKTATICYPPPSTWAALPIKKTSLSPLFTIPFPLLPVLTPCSLLTYVFGAVPFPRGWGWEEINRRADKEIWAPPCLCSVSPALVLLHSSAVAKSENVV